MQRAFITLAFLMVAVLIAACGATGATSTPTTGSAAQVSPPPTATTAPSPAVTTPVDGSVATPTAGTATPSAEQEALARLSDEVLQAMRHHDRDHMRTLMGAQMRQHMHDRDMHRLQTCLPAGASVTVVDRTVDIGDDTATVTMTIELTAADGTKSTVTRVMEFARQPDGTWALSSVPACPFQAP